MNQKLLEFNQSQKRTDIPEIKTGDIVRVHKKIKEGDKERVQIIKGLVISIKGKQSSSPTITVRREGVEMIFPIYLPTIEKIEVLRHSKIRRSKIYYMRERSGKSAKMRIKDFSEAEKTAQKEERETIRAEKETAKKDATELKKEVKPETPEKKPEETPKESAPTEETEVKEPTPTEAKADKEEKK